MKDKFQLAFINNKHLQMIKVIFSVIMAGLVLLGLSVLMFYVSVYFFPAITQEYLSAVFRNSGKSDWLYYTHPFVVSIALKWFWERYKGIFVGPLVVRALEVAMVYGIVALIPVLWITYSAIDVSFSMVVTWFMYGLIQAFTAGIVFAKLNP
jgi:hypothetical protein